MGNHKFRLSNMIPNAWFFKLKEIGTTTTKNNNRSSPKKKTCPSPTLVAPAPFSSPTSTHKDLSTHHHRHPSDASDHHNQTPTSTTLSHSRKSYHFTRQLATHQNSNSPKSSSVSNTRSSSVDSPRKSTRKSRRSHHSKRRSSTTSCSSTTTTNSTATRYYSSSTATTGCSCGGASDPNSTLQSSLNSPSHNRHLPTGETLLNPASTFDRVTAWSPPAGCDCDGRSDIVIEVDEKSLSRLGKKTGDAWSDDAGGVALGLAPIKTDHNRKLNGTTTTATAVPARELVGEKVKARKSASKYNNREKTATNGLSRLSGKGGNNNGVGVTAEESVASSPAPHRRFLVAGSPGGVRLRINSPRIASRRSTQGNHHNYSSSGRKSNVSNNTTNSTTTTSGRRRKSISAESLAIVKSSFDPQRDFRDSMVEMIVENNINASKDLEELLACYLSLNADEYHEVIIKVFKQLWFDMNIIKANGKAKAKVAAATNAQIRR